MGEVIRNGCATIFLNRICGRKCTYCNVVDRSLESKRLSVTDWKKAFSILEGEGVKFYLCIGTEPLLMGKDLVEIVKFWKERDYEYGIYSTAPSGIVETMLPELIASGMRNWSSGIDFIPEVYEKMKPNLSRKCTDLVEKEKDGLVRKAIDGIEGMRIARSFNIEELLVLITISRMNVEMVPEMVSWLVNEFGIKLHIGYNYIEVGKEGLDFAAPASECFEYLFNLEDEAIFREFVNKMRALSTKDWLRIQIPFEYLDNWAQVLSLDMEASTSACVMGIECDGSLRKCGYGKGKYVSEFSVFDLTSSVKRRKIWDAWVQDLISCGGCYWAFMHLVSKLGVKVLDFRSSYWSERDRKYGIISE